MGTVEHRSVEGSPLAAWDDRDERRLGHFSRQRVQTRLVGWMTGGQLRAEERWQACAGAVVLQKTCSDFRLILRGCSPLATRQLCSRHN